jgi:hypothetical protein
MKRSTFLVAAVGAVGALSSGCHAPPAGSDLFPLDAGHQWQYRVVTEYEGETPEVSSLSLLAQGRDDLDGKATYKRRSEDGVNYWLRRDETGIYRVAMKSDIDEEPKPDATPRYVIKLPLAVGTTWRSNTTSYLLRRRQEFPREIRHSHPAVPMQYSIESIDAPVTVPTGTYEHCTQIKGVATVRIFADPVVGWREMPLTTLEWYCPGIGLVKLERDEPGQTTFLTGGKTTMQLESFK